MSGAFQTSREIFDNPIWKNITEFRIFFLIYGSAIFAEEGYRVSNDLHLERGQWLRSTRKLQDDLMFIDNRQTKKYSTATINRCIKSLVASQRLCTKTHELGTVFTVVNYESYQGFGGYKKDNLEQNLEHSRNSNETVTKQRRNNNNKDNKEIKVKKEVIKILYGDHVLLSDEQFQKLTNDLTEPVLTKLIDDINYWFTQKPTRIKDYKDHNLMIRKWHKNNLDKPLTVINGGQSNFRPNNRGFSGKQHIPIIADGPKSAPLSEEERAEMLRMAELLDNDKVSNH
jgi:hypothetical protein